MSFIVDKSEKESSITRLTKNRKKSQNKYLASNSTEKLQVYNFQQIIFTK